jgi:electron transfer flavoprotein alpha subunit
MSAQDILVFAETSQDKPADIVLELLAAARPLAASTGGQVVAVLLGPESARCAEALSAADRIVVVDDAQLNAYAPGPYVAALQGVIASRGPRAVLIGSTSIGLDVAPLIGARLGAPVVGGCQKIEADGDVLKVTASLCAGKMLADVEVKTSPAILLVQPGSYRPSEEAGKSEVETIKSPVPLEPGAVTFEEMILPEAGDVDITQEEFLVGVGRGIQQEDDMEVAEELAKALGGQLCASRPIIDQGWLPTTRQVGKSGMIVKPKFYIALGISGAPEHSEGMKDADLIFAVNTDPDAPIFEVADYGVVADLMDVVPALTEAIQSRSS